MLSDLLVALDTETTGLDPKVDRIIEISVVAFTPAGLTGDSFTSRVNPQGRPIPAEVTRLTGISDEDVADAPFFADIVERFEAFVADAGLVAYNAAFDISMLEAEYDRIGRAMPGFMVRCAMEAAKRQKPGASATLQAVCARYGIDTAHRTKHGALTDAILAAEVWNAIHRTPELTLSVTQNAAVAASALEIRTFGEGPLAVLGLRSDLSIFASSLTPDAAARRAAELGYEACALADFATTAGLTDFAGAAEMALVRPIGGVGIEIAPFGGEVIAYPIRPEGQVVVNRIATIASRGSISPSILADAIGPARSAIALVAGTAALTHANAGLDALRTLALQLTRTSDVVALALPRGERRLEQAAALEATIAKAAYEEGLPVVAYPLIRAADDQGRHAASLMARLGTLADDGMGILALPSPDVLEQIYADVPGATANARWLAAMLANAPRPKKPVLPSWREIDGTPGPSFRSVVEAGLARRMAQGRLSARFPIEAYEDRLDVELSLIEASGFDGYYRIVADMVAAARERGIPVGPGRGSGAGSLVAYVLEITNIDPLPYGLLFERFINPERVSLPDFDIDFCEERRGEVISYLGERWGRENVAGVAAYGRIKARQAVKDSARLASMSYGQAERIAAALPDREVIPELEDIDGDLAELATNADVAAVLEDARSITGLARSRSRHAAGVVISDRPIVEAVATFDDPDTGEPIACLDKDGVEAVGLVKFDVLGVGALTTIERARQSLTRLGIEVDPWALPLDDPKTLALFDQGLGVGVFQMESAGISAAARRMGIERFEDIIALVALYRPGPMAHIETLAARKRGLEPARADHPALEALLAETYGVMIYQEQVIEAARILAGFSLGEADLLRRAMGKKIPAEMRAQEDRFVRGFVSTGSGSAAEARAMFELIDRFAGYGFNKSHAAAYALVAYATAWLKAHHPAALIAASLDVKLNDADAVSALSGEARRLGVPMLPPDCLRPSDRFSVEPTDDGLAVRWPLSAVRGIGRSTARAMQSRPPHKATIDALASAVTRAGTQLATAAIGHLAGAGALDGFYPSRADAIVRAPRDWKAATASAAALAAGQGSLFGADQIAANLPVETEADEEIDLFAAERAALGVNLCDHPADRLAQTLRRVRAVTLGEAAAGRSEGEPPRLAVGYVDQVRKPRNGRGLSLMLSDGSGRAEMALTTNCIGAEHAEKGAILAVWTAPGSDGRVRIGRIEPASEVAGRLGQALRVTTSRGFDMQLLRATLKGTPQGPMAIEVMGEDGRLLTRTPPCTFGLDGARIAAIARLPGVADVTTIN